MQPVERSGRGCIAFRGDAAGLQLAKPALADNEQMGAPFLPQLVPAAFGQGEHTSTIDFIGSSTFSDTKWYNGWTAGVGTEYAINKHWSLKGEYRYTDLGSETLNLGGVGTKVNLVNQSVDFGVNYRF